MPSLMNVLHSISPDGPDGLFLALCPLPEPGPGQVRVRVHRCGLSFPDVLMARDLYQVKPERPYVPGTEIAGEVDVLGEGVSQFARGDRVIGLIPQGGMAEYAIVPVADCHPIPDVMSFDHAAAFIANYGTAFHALVQRGQLRGGERMLVLGAAGGVGLAAVQLGKALGARVVAAASTPEKVASAAENGADETLLYPPSPFDKEQGKAFSAALKALAPDGFDVVCDIVGGDYTEPTLRAMAWEGRLLIIGFPAGIARVPMNLPLLKGCQIAGVFYGAYIARDPTGNLANISALMKLYEAGKISPPVSACYQLEKAAEAFRQLEGRKSSGKIVIATG